MVLCEFIWGGGGAKKGIFKTNYLFKNYLWASLIYKCMCQAAWDSTLGRRKMLRTSKPKINVVEKRWSKIFPITFKLR